VPSMETGATDGLYLRNAGLPVYGVTGLFVDPTNPDDVRAHGLNERIGVKLDDNVAARLKEKLAQEPNEIGGRKVEKINRIDGVKFLFAGSDWMLMRPSGTEPMVRIYAESESKQDLEALLEAGRRYLLD